MNLSTSIIVEIIEILSGIGGLYYTFIKILDKYKKSNKNKSDELLKEAKKYSDEIKDELELKISLLESEIHNLEDNVKKDIEHVKEIQTNEIRNLSVRIDQLRDELNTGHQQLIGLLTKLVNKS
jgi:phenylalanyl-tRNA synthetase alpha subunit